MSTDPEDQLPWHSGSVEPGGHDSSVTAASEASSFRVGTTKGFFSTDTLLVELDLVASGTATRVSATGQNYRNFRTGRTLTAKKTVSD